MFMSHIFKFLENPEEEPIRIRAYLPPPKKIVIHSLESIKSFNLKLTKLIKLFSNLVLEPLIIGMKRPFSPEVALG